MPDEKTITLSFGRFIDRYLLGASICVAVDKRDAHLIAAIDSEEQQTHVQFYELDEPYRELKEPLLWRKSKWMESERKRVIVKHESELRRKATTKLHDNINATAKLLAQKTKLSVKDVLWIAEKIVLEGDKTFLQTIGINPTELTPDEQKALGRTFTIIQ